MLFRFEGLREVQLNIFFFFQAEDGIRDYKVTGVQTCALPIATGQPFNRRGHQVQCLPGDIFSLRLRFSPWSFLWRARSLCANSLSQGRSFRVYSTEREAP